MPLQHSLLPFPRRKIAVVPLLLIIPLLLRSQAPCYEKLRQEGMAQIRQRHYAEAINNLWAALTSCDDTPRINDLSALIQQAQDSWIKELEGSIKREKEAYKAAVAAKEEAEQARQNETNARQMAEANARQAKEQGLRAETLRLALLADLTRGKGQRSDALLLSWVALQLAGAETPAYLQRAFCEAVRDSFATGIFTGDKAVDQIQLLPGAGGLAIKQNGTGLLWTQVDAGGQRIRQFGAETEGLAVAPKGNTLLSWNNKNTAQLWTAGGQPERSLEGHAEAIRFAAFSADEQYVVTCSRDNTARLWSAGGDLIATLNGHNGNVYFAEFSPDNQTVLTRSADGTACTWDIRGARLGAFPADQNSYLFDARLCGNSKRLLTLDAAGRADLWEVQGKHLTRLGQAGQSARSFEMAAGGARALVRTKDNGLGLYSTLDGRLLAQLPHTAILEGFSTDSAGTRILSWTADFTLRLWDDQGQLLRTFQGHRGALTDARLSPDQRLVLSTAQDGTVKLWDTAGNILIDWPVESRRPLPARFSPDGQFILVAEKDNTRITRLPLPQNIYDALGRTVDRAGSAVAQLAASYNIQFLDTLSH